MVRVRADLAFVKKVKKLRDPMLKSKVKKQIAKLIANPEM